MVKPFDFEELVARLEALHRRAHNVAPATGGSRTLQGGGVEIDLAAGLVRINDQPLETTVRERGLMTLFLNNPNRALTRERILNTVWDLNADPHTNVVDVYVARLRKKLGDAGAQIKTVHGVGYRFDPADHLEASRQPLDLAKLGLVDAPEEEAFDRLTRLTARLLSAPVSLLSIVEPDRDRQYFKSEIGLQEPWATRRSTPLSHSFCKFVAESDTLFRVEDARSDPRVAGNSAIEDLNVSAYLGAPVRCPAGRAIAALCAIDVKPRVWNDRDVRTLELLADMASNEILLRAALATSRDSVV